MRKLIPCIMHVLKVPFPFNSRKGFSLLLISLIEAAATVALLGLAGTKRDLSDGKSFPIV